MTIIFHQIESLSGKHVNLNLSITTGIILIHPTCQGEKLPQLLYLIEFWILKHVMSTLFHTWIEKYIYFK